jgi:hypothetical protein
VDRPVSVNCQGVMDDTIIDRIAFGGVKELEDLYQQ